jgi:hypothetical protein
LATEQQFFPPFLFWSGRKIVLHAGLWIRIRIQWLCGSESGFSDFVDPDPYWESGSRDNKFKKFILKSYLKKILPLKRYKIALITFWWITVVFLIWFDSNFDFKKIWERINCLRKFWFSLDPDPEPDPDPDWAKMLDQDQDPY